MFLLLVFVVVVFVVVVNVLVVVFFVIVTNFNAKQLKYLCCLLLLELLAMK